jgi:hypothetical protein
MNDYHLLKEGTGWVTINACVRYVLVIVLSLGVPWFKTLYWEKPTHNMSLLFADTSAESFICALSSRVPMLSHRSLSAFTTSRCVLRVASVLLSMLQLFLSSALCRMAHAYISMSPFTLWYLKWFYSPDDLRSSSNLKFMLEFCWGRPPC